MVIDTSAFVAILLNEPETRSFAELIKRAEQTSMSAASLVEAFLVLGAEHDEEIDALLLRAGITVVSVDHAQADAARRAHRVFGRGSGSRAHLNFGDCFSYALAKALDEPLLFKGDDFTHTDVTPALKP